MKAYLLKNNGGPENLLLSETTRPVPGDHEVLIQTRAISVNPVDAYVRRDQNGLFGILQTNAQQGSWILGWDLAGTVVETGSQVTRFKAGDEVFGLVNFPGQGKTYAEFVAAPEEQLALKPAQISFGEAAAASLAAVTAWQALVTHANLQKGEKVLIHAAAGGVGHYAVQIAKSLGAYVIAVGSAAGKELALGVGADEYIDYNEDQFAELVKDVDVVTDPIFTDEHILQSIQTLRKGGRLINLQNFLQSADVQQAVRDKELFAIRMSVTSNGSDIRQIAQLLADGKIRSVIATEYTFNDLPKTHAQIETGKTKGKIIINL